MDFIPDAEAGLRPNIREILFLDTTRLPLVPTMPSFFADGSLTWTVSLWVTQRSFSNIVIRMRRCSSGGRCFAQRYLEKYRIKFKAEALPLKDRIPRLLPRVLYSHNCVFGLSQVHDADRTSMRTLVRIFPALGILKREPDEKVRLCE